MLSGVLNMNKLNINQIIKKQLVGKTLLKLEYRDNDIIDENTGRQVILPSKIVGTYLGINDSREDVGVYLVFDDHQEIFVYDNEDIELSDE